MNLTAKTETDTVERNKFCVLERVEDDEARMNVRLGTE